MHTNAHSTWELRAESAGKTGNSSGRNHSSNSHFLPVLWRTGVLLLFLLSRSRQDKRRQYSQPLLWLDRAGRHPPSALQSQRSFLAQTQKFPVAASSGFLITRPCLQTKSECLERIFPTQQGYHGARWAFQLFCSYYFGRKQLLQVQQVTQRPMTQDLLNQQLQVTKQAVAELL